MTGGIRFVCPGCGATHDRGYLDGVGLFRCLRCGETTTENAAPKYRCSRPYEVRDKPGRCLTPIADYVCGLELRADPSPEPRGWSPSSDRLYASDGAGAIPHSASDFVAPLISLSRIIRAFRGAL